jgi:hypothetical protein
MCRLSLVLSLIASPLAWSQNPPAPALANLAFLSGHWTGDEGQSHSDEIWSDPAGTSIIGMYREVEQGKPVFYEFWAIELDGATPVFKMKHFNAGMIGWENKDEMVRLPVTESSSTTVIFAREDGKLTIRYVLEDPNHLTSTLERIDKQGQHKSDVFHFHRAASAVTTAPHAR